MSDDEGTSNRHYSLSESVCDDGDESEKGETKRKSRNLSEKKRRDQFNMLIHELLSMVSCTNRKMDKTTVLKTAISFLRKQNEIAAQSHAHEVKENWKPSFLTNDEFMQIMLDASNGFVLVITKVGIILYVSENVTSVLGFQTSDLINHSIFDYVHKDDIPVLYNQLAQHHFVASDDDIQDYEREENQVNFFFRMRQETYPPVYHLLSSQGCFRFLSNKESVNSITGLPMKPTSCYCCVVRRSNPPCMHELSYIDDVKNEFTSRQSTEWKFLFLDHRGPLLIGYQPFELLGTSMYEYIHPDDLEMLANSHKELAETGKSQSCYYRFLTKGEQWLWLESSYYISYNQWNSKPEFIVCTNTVVSLPIAQNSLKEKASKQPQPSRQVTELSCTSSTMSQVRKNNQDSPKTAVCTWSPDCAPSGQTEDSPRGMFQNQPATNSTLYPDNTENTSPQSTENMSQGTSTASSFPSASQANTVLSQLMAPCPSSSNGTMAPAGSSVTGSNMSQVPPSPSQDAPQHANQGSAVKETPSTSNQVLSIRQMYLTTAQQLLFNQLQAKHKALLDTLNRQQEGLQSVLDMLHLSRDTFIIPPDSSDEGSGLDTPMQIVQDSQQLTMQQQGRDLLIPQQHVPTEQRLQASVVQQPVSLLNIPPPIVTNNPHLSNPLVQIIQPQPGHVRLPNSPVHYGQHTNLHLRNPSQPSPR